MVNIRTKKIILQLEKQLDNQQILINILTNWNGTHIGNEEKQEDSILPADTPKMQNHNHIKTQAIRTAPTDDQSIGKEVKTSYVSAEHKVAPCPIRIPKPKLII